MTQAERKPPGTSDLLEWAKISENTLKMSTGYKLPSLLYLKNACQVCSKTKVMPDVFSNYEGIVHHEYTPKCQAINQHPTYKC